MTKKQCYSCKFFNSNHMPNNITLSFVDEYCDIPDANNKYLMSDEECPFYKFG